MEPLDDLILRARAGDLDAYGDLVRATQTMAYAVARGVLRDPALAEDAAQEAYVRAFRHLRELDAPPAFPAWFRRIVITVALNMRRAHRRTLVQVDDLPDIPVLDERETEWTDLQRQRLAAALLTLTAEERRICDRRYHGAWSTARLARDAHVDEAAMRKRLQRIRDKLRKEVEMSEQRAIRPGEIRPDFPAKVVELLAQPTLTDLPEHPVGSVVEQLHATYPEFHEAALPEIVDLVAARESAAGSALYLDLNQVHRIDDRRILRYDLTLPMLLSVQYAGQPLRVFAAGKTYRACEADATHLETFHQAEILWMDDRSRLDAWLAASRILRSIDVLFPGREVKIVPTRYPMCAQAWEMEVEYEGRWVELLAWGVFTDRIVEYLGGSAASHTAIGVGHGLERFAMLRYGIDDIRKIENARLE